MHVGGTKLARMSHVEVKKAAQRTRFH